MTYDYFYGNQSDQFSFYRIPKALFTDEHFKTISAESKILYGILLDRMNLSQKNGWLDPDGRVFNEKQSKTRRITSVEYQNLSNQHGQRHGAKSL